MSTPSLLDEIERGPEQIEQMSFDQLISAGLESTHIETGVEAVRESPPPRRLEAPVTGRHQDVCLYLTMLLKSFVEVTDAGLVRDAPFEVRLNDTQVYEPDIVFLANANFDRIHETYIEGPPDIVIEVLTVDSTALDRGEKFAAYEAAGVREYWIVDPLAQKVTILEWVDGLYEEQVYQGEAVLVSPLLPALSLTAATVLNAGC
jgi:Uma2 family endonuclease